MMLRKTFASEIDAESWCDDVAAAAGMPWIGGTDVGGGRHVPPGTARTERVVSPDKESVTVDEALLASLDAKQVLDEKGAVIAVVDAVVDVSGFVTVADEKPIDILPVEEGIVEP